MANAFSGDIALIGMAGIYPAAETVERLWNNILAKVEAVTDAPASWRPEKYYEAFDPDVDGWRNDKTYCKRGGFIDEFATFDPLEFGIMPGSVDGSDPAHFLALRVAREALADAGYAERTFDRTRTGVIIGRGSYPHRGFSASAGYGIAKALIDLITEAIPGVSAEAMARIEEGIKSRLPPFTPDTCPGLVSNLFTGRIANRLDLMGPNYLVDAACASSLIALDAGMKELQCGRCNMVLVGGAQANCNAGVFIVFSMLGALSRRGHLRPFGKNADGTLLGEGLGMAVIKRLEDAERDGDRIYAVVKGVGLSSDGQGQAFLVPRLEGEIAAMTRAYELADVPPESVDLVEAHGTATPVGDRTEVQAMGRVFGDRNGSLPRLAIGSVKSMISHTIPASGMASLFKSSLSLYHKILPPTLCEEPNPELGIEKTALYLNTETRPWISGKPHPRRAGVSSFGFGGINAHAVLEEYTGPQRSDDRDTFIRAWENELVVFHGASRDALLGRMQELDAFLAKEPDTPLRDVAFTVNGTPSPESAQRLAIVADSVPDLRAKIEKAAARLRDAACRRIQDRGGIYYADEPMARQGKLAFMLPGEGAQYAGMLQDLCLYFPEVRRWFDRADRAYVAAGREPLPSQVAFPPTHLMPAEQERLEAALWSMDYAVTLIVAADGALFNLFLMLGIRPDAVVGHSTAQDLALEAAGFIDEMTNDNIMDEPVVEERVIQDSVRADVPPAQLLSVGACDPATVAALAKASGGKLFVAMDNCPNQVVLCGAAEDIAQAQEALVKEGALCHFLPFDRAYHTPLYRPICDQLEKTTPVYAKPLPKIAAYCTTTAAQFPADRDAIRRIMIDQWAEPIRFRETVEQMHADGIRLFVEVGPRGNLTGFAQDTLSGKAHVCVPSNVTSRSGLTQLHHMLGQLAAHGVAMDLGYLYARRGAVRLPVWEPAAPAEEASPRKRRLMKLAYDMPVIELADSEKADLRQALATALGAEGVGATGIAAAVGSLPGGAPPPLADPQSRSRVMEAYLRTMEQFLSTQEQILSSLHARPRTGEEP